MIMGIPRHRHSPLKQAMKKYSEHYLKFKDKYAKNLKFPLLKIV